jgi:hypothetical protein
MATQQPDASDGTAKTDEEQATLDGLIKDLNGMIDDLEKSASAPGGRTPSGRPVVFVRPPRPGRPGGAPPVAHDLLDRLINIGRRATDTAHSRRSGAHDLLDQVVAASRHASRSSRALRSGLERLRTELMATSPAAAPSGPVDGSLPVIVLPPNGPGGETSGSLDISNAGPERVRLELQCAALVGPGAASIQPQLVFHPHPAEIEPQSTARVELSLTIPDDAGRGTYVGVLEAAGAPGVQAVVRLHVV